MSRIPGRERGHKADGDGQACSEVERLLDSLVEEVLAEANPDGPGSERAAAAMRDPVEAFRHESAAFLRPREDANELIGRLRALLSQDANMPLPSVTATSATPDAATAPGEVRHSEGSSC